MQEAESPMYLISLGTLEIFIIIKNVSVGREMF